MDSGWLTAVRTGVGAALGTHLLARPGSRDVGVVGAGVQGRATLRALSRLRRLSSVHVHDVVPEAAAAFAEEVHDELGIPVQVRSSAAEVAGAGDVLVVATWGREPVLDADTVRPGTHVTSLGADEPGKVELAASLLDLALVVTDDRRLAASVLPRVDTTIGAVLRGDHPGRQADGQVTVYSPVGLPLQDCVIAWHAHRHAAARGPGLVVDLEQ
jgi:ornithine cyclodeaminase